MDGLQPEPGTGGRNLNSFDEVSVKAGEVFVGSAAVTVANAQALRKVADLLRY